MTVGQKMGMDAHMMAKFTSRHEKMRTSGHHQVKSYIVVVLLYFRPDQRRRMAIITTLWDVSGAIRKALDVLT